MATENGHRVRAVLVVDGGRPSLAEATVQAFVAVGARVALAADPRPGGSAGGVDRPSVVRLPSAAPGPLGAEARMVEAVDRLGSLDACVGLLATRSRVPFMHDEADAWEADVADIVLVASRLARAAAAAMTGSTGRGGAIVLVGSVDTTHAYPGRSAASVGMAGLLGLVRALGVELAGTGVRVNLVIVGPLGDEAGGPPTGAAAAVAERTRLRAPTQRWTTPAQAASAIRFVASPEAEFMTGQSLRVDGGWASLNQAPEGMRFP